MNAVSLGLYLQMFLASAPVMIVCLGACVVIACKWQKGSSWQVWALMGFGLGLMIAIAIPITQALVQAWVVQSGEIGSRAWVFAVLSGVWSILHACVYVLLFVAVLEGRK